MVKSTTDFAERNSEQITNATRIKNATRTGWDWVQELTKQNIRQAQAIVITTHKVADDLCEQGSAIRQHSFAVAEGTLSNTLDFLQKLSHLKEPRELTLIQSEFVSRQAQVLGEGGKELAQTIVQGTGKIVQKASEMTNAEHQRSEAA
jgi:Phasin protein